ncbi:MAG: tetratricopeptide repeat protein [Leptolyngbya sp. RL_3_1]|nr:tetratricopeptide repeat protein [Leptolyngbya sp. RL_3_1]
MAAKRNRWLVVSVLVVAIGAFLALSLLPLLSGRSPRPGVASTSSTTQTNAATELEDRARGYELVLEREPDNETAILGLVETRIQLGDLQGVVEPLAKLSDMNPDIPEYRVLLGQTKQALGDSDGAAEAYRNVLTNRPGEMNALQGLVQLLLAQDRPQAAIGLLQDTLQTAVQTNDLQAGTIDVVSVRLLLGEVYVQQERFEDAIDAYDEAIAQAAEDFRPLLAKALVLRDLERQGEASSLFAQAEALAPDQYKDQIRQMASAGTAASDTEVSPVPTGDASSGLADEETSEPNAP